MKNKILSSIFIISILIVLFSGACKSKPAPAPQAPRATATAASTPVSTVPPTTPGTTVNPTTAGTTIPPVTPGTTVTPATPGTTTITTTPASSTTATTPVTTTTGNTYGTSSSGAYNRHQSGIILDGAVNYTVIRGDTLNGIARRLYSDGSLYPLIMMASGIIIDPDKILPQMRLTIPALRANMDDPTARQSINRYFLQIADIEDQRGRHDTAALVRGHTRQ